MNRHRSHRFFIHLGITIAACLGLGACDGDGDEGIDDLVDALIDEVNLQAEEACDCHAEFGYESRTECVDDFGHIGPSRERCVKDAYTEDESASRQYLECVLPLEREFSSCANERFVCDDLGGVQACIDDYDVGLMECITLPGSVVRELDACFGDGSGG